MLISPARRASAAGLPPANVRLDELFEKISRGDVRSTADARRTEVDLPALGHRDHVGDGLHARVLVRRHAFRRGDRHRDGLQLIRFIAAARNQRLVDRERRGRDENRIAIRGRNSRLTRGADAAAAFEVLSDEALSEPVAKARAHDPRDRIGEPASREPDEHIDALRRVLRLRPRWGARHNRDKSECRQRNPTLCPISHYFLQPGRGTVAPRRFPVRRFNSRRSNLISTNKIS
jgi:hypothetical protein